MSALPTLYDLLEWTISNTTIGAKAIGRNETLSQRFTHKKKNPVTQNNMSLEDCIMSRYKYQARTDTYVTMFGTTLLEDLMNLLTGDAVELKKKTVQNTSFQDVRTRL